MSQTARYTLQVGTWDELRAPASAVRFAVFVAEQGIAAELELDDRDVNCVHAVVFDGTGEPVGTGRLLPDAQIGRMAVLAAQRGNGLGTRILRALMANAVQRGMREVRLHAQIDAVAFYERVGFCAVGATYLEAGIVHQTMVRGLATGDDGAR